MEHTTTRITHIARRLGGHGLTAVIVLLALAVALAIGVWALLEPAAADPVLAAPIRWMV